MPQVSSISNTNLLKQSQVVKASTTKQPTKQTAENKIHHTKTHASLTLGGVAALGISLATFLARKNIDVHWAKIAAPITATLVGFGALKDFLINKTNKKFVDENKNKTIEEVFLTNKKAETTKKQNIYYETNTGKKVSTALGAIGGAATLPIFAMIDSKYNKIPFKESYKDIISFFSKTKNTKIATIIITLITASIGALTGFIEGSIIDCITNLRTRRKVDKMAEKANNATA